MCFASVQQSRRLAPPAGAPPPLPIGSPDTNVLYDSIPSRRIISPRGSGTFTFPPELLVPPDPRVEGGVAFSRMQPVPIKLPRRAGPVPGVMDIAHHAGDSEQERLDPPSAAPRAGSTPTSRSGTPTRRSPLKQALSLAILEAQAQAQQQGRARGEEEAAASAPSSPAALLRSSLSESVQSILAGAESPSQRLLAMAQSKGAAPSSSGSTALLGTSSTAAGELPKLGGRSISLLSNVVQTLGSPSAAADSPAVRASGEWGSAFERLANLASKSRATSPLASRAVSPRQSTGAAGLAAAAAAAAAEQGVASNSSNSNISQLMASINQAMFEAEVQAQAQMQAQQEVQQRFLQRQVGRGRGSLPLHTRLCVACC